MGEKLCYITAMKKTYCRKALIIALVSLWIFSSFNLSAAEAPAEKEPPLQSTEPSSGEDLGYGVGSVLASVFYSPFKLTYAGLGLVTGGLGFVLSAGNTDVANNIINPAVRGNYVVTPRHLKGEEPLIFVGAAPAPEAQQATAVASPAR